MPDAGEQERASSLMPDAGEQERAKIDVWHPSEFSMSDEGGLKIKVYDYRR